MARRYSELSPEERADFDEILAGLLSEHPHDQEATREAAVMLRTLVEAMRAGTFPCLRMALLVLDDDTGQLGCATTEDYDTLEEMLRVALQTNLHGEEYAPGNKASFTPNN